MYAKGVKVYQFKAEDFEIKPHTLCLGYVSKGFTNYNMKKNGLNGYVFDFSFDYRGFDIDDIVNIYKYLMK